MENSEQQGNDLGQKQPKIHSRKEFLLKTAKGAALLVGTTVAISQAREHEYLREPVLLEDPEVGNGSALEESIEEKFDIRLTPSTPEIWSEERLKMLDQFISYLPEHFHQPKGWGPWHKKLTIRISTFRYAKEAEMGNSSGVCACGPTFLRGDDLIMINWGSFLPSRRKESFQLFTHELVHRVTPDLDKITNALPFPVRNRISTDPSRISQLVEETEKKMILVGERNGVKIINPDKGYAQFGNIQFGPEVTPEERNEFQFYIYFMQSLGNNSELVAHLGAYYAFGKDHFYKMYGKMLPKYEVDSLYKFVKDEIYKGKEYGPLPFDGE